jgi:hypothetical protein
VNDLVTWLLEQIAEDERLAHDDHEPSLIDYDSHGYHPDGYEPEIIYSSARVLAECATKRAIIEWHKNWPVLVETPPTFEPTALDDPQSTTLRMTKQIAWLTQQQYRERFGDEPPTAPILRHLAAPYADRPGYQEEWRP